MRTKKAKLNKRAWAWLDKAVNNTWDFIYNWAPTGKNLQTLGSAFSALSEQKDARDKYDKAVADRAKYREELKAAVDRYKQSPEPTDQQALEIWDLRGKERSAYYRIRDAQRNERIWRHAKENHKARHNVAATTMYGGTLYDWLARPEDYQDPRNYQKFSKLSPETQAQIAGMYKIKPFTNAIDLVVASALGAQATAGLIPKLQAGNLALAGYTGTVGTAGTAASALTASQKAKNLAQVLAYLQVATAGQVARYATQQGAHRLQKYTGDGYRDPSLLQALYPGMSLANSEVFQGNQDVRYKRAVQFQRFYEYLKNIRHLPAEQQRQAIQEVFPNEDYQIPRGIPRAPTAHILSDMLVRKIPGLSYLDDATNTAQYFGMTMPHEYRPYFQAADPSGWAAKFFGSENTAVGVPFRQILAKKDYKNAEDNVFVTRAVQQQQRKRLRIQPDIATHFGYLVTDAASSNSNSKKPLPRLPDGSQLWNKDGSAKTSQANNQLVSAIHALNQIKHNQRNGKFIVGGLQVRKGSQEAEAAYNHYKKQLQRFVSQAPRELYNDAVTSLQQYDIQQAKLNAARSFTNFKKVKAAVQAGTADKEQEAAALAELQNAISIVKQQTKEYEQTELAKFYRQLNAAQDEGKNRQTQRVKKLVALYVQSLSQDKQKAAIARAWLKLYSRPMTPQTLGQMYTQE